MARGGVYRDSGGVPAKVLVSDGVVTAPGRIVPSGALVEFLQKARWSTATSPADGPTRSPPPSSSGNGSARTHMSSGGRARRRNVTRKGFGEGSSGKAPDWPRPCRLIRSLESPLAGVRRHVPAIPSSSRTHGLAQRVSRGPRAGGGSMIPHALALLNERPAHWPRWAPSLGGEAGCSPRAHSRRPRWTCRGGQSHGGCTFLVGGLPGADRRSPGSSRCGVLCGPGGTTVYVAEGISTSVSPDARLGRGNGEQCRFFVDLASLQYSKAFRETRSV